MNRFSSYGYEAMVSTDQQYFKYEGRCGEGYQRHLKEERRLDAQARDARTPHERTRAHRLHRCACYQEVDDA